MGNAKVVHAIYEAFGRGDIPGILENLAEHVEWEYAYKTAPNPIPWLQPRHDKAGVAKFFESLSSLEFHKFTPNVLLEGPGVVVALVDIEASVRRTGKRIIEQDEPHIWYFNEVGKVVRFRHAADTYQQVMAYQG